MACEREREREREKSGYEGARKSKREGVGEKRLSLPSAHAQESVTKRLIERKEGSWRKRGRTSLSPPHA